MKGLTEEECRQWLAVSRIPEQPYQSDDPWDEAEYQQIKLPVKSGLRRMMIRNVVEACKPFDSALLQLTDWFPDPDQFAVLSAIRGFLGETRRPIDAPGHLFAPDESDILVGLTMLIADYNWSAYIYFSHRTAIYWWEGEMFDVFSPEEETFRRIEKAVAETERFVAETEMPPLDPDVVH